MIEADDIREVSEFLRAAFRGMHNGFIILGPLATGKIEVQHTPSPGANRVEFKTKGGLEIEVD